MSRLSSEVSLVCSFEGRKWNFWNDITAEPVNFERFYDTHVCSTMTTVHLHRGVPVHVVYLRESNAPFPMPFSRSSLAYWW